MQLSAAPYHYFIVAGHPSKAGINAKSTPGFLLVFGQLIVDGPFLTSVKIAQVKYCFGTNAFYKSQQFAIVRNLRTGSATWSTGNVFNGALYTVESFDDKYLAVGILIVLKIAAGVNVFAVINVFAISRFAKFNFSTFFMFTLI
jgi:hypothetical protein